MRKNILKFIIIFSLIFNISNSEVSAQNLDGLGKLIKILEQAPDKISGEKLEKLLIENHILVYETVRYEKQSSYQYHAEWSFNKDKTYTVIDKNNYRYNNSSIKHPAKGRWELAGLSNSSVRLDDASNTRFQISFSEDGNIYAGSEKIYSYRLENIQEKINREAKIAEEKRIAEELRLKKIEEEKRQLAIKREQIKKEEERKRLELAEWAKKEVEAKIKRDNEERIKLEREEFYKNILKYSLISIFLSALSFFIYKYRTRIKNEFYPKFIKYIKNLKLNSKEFYPKFIEYIKDIKTNSDKKLGITIIGVFFVVIVLLVTSLSGNKSSTSSQKSYGKNACDGVADQISRYIQYPQRNSNINALRNYYNEAKDLSRRFNSDPETNTNYCAFILNAAAKEFLP
jgi:hypothetical protein